MHGELLDVKHMYLPDKDFKTLDEKGNPVIYTILSSRDLTNYVLSQMMRLDPSEKPCIPDKVFDAEVAIEAHEVSAMGYAQYRLVPSESSARPLRKLGRDDALENEYYRISVNADGTLRDEDRASGYVYDRQAVLVENGDDGDSFNYSPPRQDLGSVRTRVNRKCRSRVPITAKGPRSTSPCASPRTWTRGRGASAPPTSPLRSGVAPAPSISKFMSRTVSSRIACSTASLIGIQQRP